MNEPDKPVSQRYMEKMWPQMIRDIDFASETGAARAHSEPPKVPGAGAPLKDSSLSGNSEGRVPEGPERPVLSEAEGSRGASPEAMTHCILCHALMRRRPIDASVFSVAFRPLVIHLCESCDRNTNDDDKRQLHWLFSQGSCAGALAQMEYDQKVVTALADALSKARREAVERAISIKVRDDTLAAAYRERNYFERWCQRWFLAAVTGWVCCLLALFLR